MMKMSLGKRFLLLALCVVLALVGPTSAMAATKDGWKTKSGKTYYYKNGAKVTGVVKIGSTKYAFDSKGVLQGKTAVFTWKKNYYKVSKSGVAKQWTGTSHYAAKLLASKAYRSGTSMERLKKSFAYCVKLPYKRVASINASASKMADYYGKYGLVSKTGDCTVQAYTFYWLGKVLGYKVKEVNGYLYNSKKKTYQEHSWVELNKSGKIYVCDPNFGKEYASEAKPASSKYPLGMMIKYGQKGVLPYCRADKTKIAAGETA